MLIKLSKVSRGYGRMQHLCKQRSMQPVAAAAFDAMMLLVAISILSFISKVATVLQLIFDET